MGAGAEGGGTSVCRNRKTMWVRGASSGGDGISGRCRHSADLHPRILVVFDRYGKHDEERAMRSKWMSWVQVLVTLAVWAAMSDARAWETETLNGVTWDYKAPTTSWKPLTSKPPAISMLLILGVSSWSLLALASQQHSARPFVPLETCSSLGSRTTHSWLSSHLAAAHQFYQDVCLTALCFQSYSPICSPLTSRKTFPNPTSHSYRSQ